MDKQSRFEMSIDTRTLYELLMKAEIGETVTFTAMSAALGHVVMGGDPALQSALHHAFNQDERPFANVRKVGYKRLTDAEIIASGDIETGAIRRRAKRAGKRLTFVEDFDSLTSGEKIKHNTFLSVFAAMAQITKASALKKIETEVSRTGESLPVAKTLEAFK